MNRRPLSISPIWPLIALSLTIAYCALASTFATFAETTYIAERANDAIHQDNRLLRREWLLMFIQQQMMISDQLNHPLPKAKPAF